jgi:hypothetical protein
MNPQEDHPWTALFFARWRAGVILVLCLLVFAGVIHANLQPGSHSSQYDPMDDEDVHDWSFGWPFWYGWGGFTTPARSATPSPHTLLSISRWDAFNAYYSLVNLFIACVLVASPAAVGRLRRSKQVSTGQFTLSDLFAFTKALAILFALFAVERAYEWAQRGAVVSVYSALSAYPLLDRVSISLGIVCALYEAIAALCQTFRAIVVKLRRLGKNEL